MKPRQLTPTPVPTVRMQASELGRSSDRLKRASELIQKRSPVINQGESSLTLSCSLPAGRVNCGLIKGGRYGKRD
jgi:hypothetical protein